MKHFGFVTGLIALVLALVPLQALAEELRVMSYNIRRINRNPLEEHPWVGRKDRVVQTIAAFDPDLLGTQEAYPSQVRDLEKGLEGYASFGRARSADGKFDETVAILYKTERFEKLAAGHFWLSETPEQPGSISWDSKLPRMVTWLRLRDRRRDEGGELVVMNTHWDHIGQQARLESARLMREKMREMVEDLPLIVTGDFNATEAQPPYKALLADESDRPLRDTYRELYPERQEDEATFGGFDGRTHGWRIDWILVTDHFAVAEAAIDRTSFDGVDPSDHYPVTAVLEWK